MKVEVSPTTHVHHGGPVKIGNVYANQYHKNFRIVLNVLEADLRGRPWKNIVCINVNPAGEVVGASCEPEAYMREHQDFVSFVEHMPSLKIE